MFLYVLVDYNSFDTYKIGVTKRDINIRLKELNQNPGSCIKLKYLSDSTEDYLKIEKKLHKYFKNSQTFSGENLSLREWFYMPDLRPLNDILIYEFGRGFRP
jgi:hypothetical protein